MINTIVRLMLTSLLFLDMGCGTTSTAHENKPYNTDAPTGNSESLPSEDDTTESVEHLDPKLWIHLYRGMATTDEGPLLGVWDNGRIVVCKSIGTGEWLETTGTESLVEEIGARFNSCALSDRSRDRIELEQSYVMSGLREGGVYVTRTYLSRDFSESNAARNIKWLINHCDDWRRAARPWSVPKDEWEK